MARKPRRRPDGPHVISWRNNIKEVDRLIEVHKHIAGAGPGRKFDVQVLNKSALILLLACWEAYVEDLAKNAFEFMLANCSTPSVFEDYVLAIAGKMVKNGNTQDLWSIAGDGWKAALTKHKEIIIKKYIVKGSFNTPSADNIDKLFSELIGLRSLSRQWYWPKMSHEATAEKLKELIERRGEIAHRVEASAPVYKKDVVAYRGIISRMAIITHNRTVAHVYARTSKYPWRTYRNGKTR